MSFPLKHLFSHIIHVQYFCSVSQIQFGSYDTAVRHLEPEVEQLEADVNVVGDDLSQLIDKVHEVNQSAL